MKAQTVLNEIADEKLMAEIAGGNGESFQVLAKRYMGLLYSVAFRMFPQRADAEEIVQEALLRVWSKAHLWREGSGASVSTWLYRLTYNICIDQKRRSRIQTTALDENRMDDDSLGADKRMQDVQTGEIVSEALQKLPERQRAALTLCHYEGLSNAEAADIMGTSVKAIEGLLVRARKSLAADLEKHKGVL